MKLSTGITRQVRLWLPALVSIAALTVMLSLAMSHSEPTNAIKVNLSERLAVPPVQDLNDGNRDSDLRVAIAGVLSPSKTLEAYQQLLAFMGETLDRQVSLILKPTYAEINDLVEGQRVEAAFVCSLAYVDGKQDFDMELLIVPQMYGGTVYYSYLIVPEGSKAESLQDLMGTGFAFTDPFSNSGHLAPAYQLHLIGETPTSFFARHIFTYSHDNSIRAVADKLVDGAAVDSLVYDQMVASEPELDSKTRVIARWGPYGIPPVVVSPELDHHLKQEIRDFFLNMHESEAGRSILDELAIDRFVLGSDGLYDSIVAMKAELGW